VVAVIAVVAAVLAAERAVHVEGEIYMLGAHRELALVEAKRGY